VFTREQLVEWFDIKHVNPAPARFDSDKLRWVNHEHIKKMSAEALGAALKPFLARAGSDLAQGPPPAAVAELLRDRAQTLREMADMASYFYATPKAVPEMFAERMTDAVRPALADLATAFKTIEWSRESIASEIKATAGKRGLKPPQIMMALRTIVAGTPQTPSIDAVLALVGRERTVERLTHGLNS